MILAAILRNYKCYKGINVIPFSKDNSTLNIIIGNNGVGKSAILEGMNTLFNDAKWIVNNESNSKNEPFVGAFMLLEKNRLNSFLDTKDKEIIAVISDYFWHFTMPSSTMYKGYEPLFPIRDSKLSLEDTHYLLLVGREFGSKAMSFLSFSNSVRTALNVLPVKPTTSTTEKLLDKIISAHAYIYIPVETPVSSFVRLQNKSMQTLMDRDIKDSIASALNNKRITRKKDKKRETHVSVLTIINEELESYVKTVETDIQKEYVGYSYQPAPRQVSKLTANHVTDTIIEAFYSKRAFRKDGKNIENLSSGEKRVILIDIISAFIQKNTPNRFLIVSIDEPENSLHISKCYEQFQKINKISLDYNHQIFVTTHWYGSLPCLKKGGLVHINDNSIPALAELKNYFEERGTLPDDIQLKGYFDLSSSLLYAFRNSSQTMLLVEGYEDKRYIDYYLSDLNLNVIPVGGCGNVKKVYGYLFTPMNDKEMVDVAGTQKIVCMVDTDVLCTQLSMDSISRSENLRLIRLHQEANNDATLLLNKDPNKFPTEMEDVLEPALFYSALSNCINSYGSAEEKAVFSVYQFNTASKYSRIKGDYSILSSTVVGRDIAHDKEVISGFIDANKDNIAQEYVKIPKTGMMPSWVAKLRIIIESNLKNK